jgi:hypothetical protein
VPGASRTLFFSFLQRSETRKIAADLKTNTDVLATSVFSLPLLSIHVAKSDLNTRIQSNLIFPFLVSSRAATETNLGQTPFVFVDVSGHLLANEGQQSPPTASSTNRSDDPPDNINCNLHRDQPKALIPR